MADYNTTINYNGDGTTKDFAIPFSYISKTDVKVSRQNGTVSYTWINPNLIRLSSPLAVGDTLTVKRETAIGTQAVSFVNGAVPTAQQFNSAFNQTLFSAQESNDTVNRGLFKDGLGRYDANNSRFINVADPVNAKDAANKQWVETSGTSYVVQAQNAATAASASASAASTSATSANNSAATANTKANQADVSAASAAASAATATTKATEAANSAAAAATSASTVGTTAATATTKAAEAASSATNAANSAAAASSSASSANTSATNAATSASTAASKAADANTAATSAATSASSAQTNASIAVTNATSAATKASEAATSATNAAASAATATTKASEAAASAADAATSQEGAQFAWDGAQAVYSDFDTRYLGSFSNPPTVDNLGNALQTGALYWDSSSNTMKTWSGTAWLAAYVSLGDALTASNNLSDLTSPSNARTNLGLGNVENKSSATIRSEITSTNVTTALGYTPYNGATNPNGYITVSALSSYQPLDADLTAIAGLVGTTGILKKTAADTWALDTSAYLTGNQSISVSGDATGSGTTSIALTLANSGVTAGTYTKVTVDAKGRVTTGASLASADLPTYTGTITSSQVTTALGYTPYNSSNPSGYITSAALTPYAPLASPSFTGTASFVAVKSGVSAVAASAIDCSAGNFFTKTASGALTWTVSNVPSSGAFSFILELTNGGTGTQTWFTGIKWPGGTAPTLTASGIDLLGFITDDGGTTWRGVQLMKDSK